MENFPNLQLSDFDYALPPDRIAQVPLGQRDSSRLLVLTRADQTLAHRHFTDLPDYLHPGDVLVLNDTRVTAQRLFGSRPGHPDERLEAFLTERVADGVWHSLVRPGKKWLPGAVVEFGDSLSCEVLERTDDRGGRLLRFFAPADAFIEDVISARAQAPLPPYIQTLLPPENRERYQTVYADQGGSAAAPTAGLHFTPELLAEIAARGVKIACVTLHVGMGTFRPIKTDDIAAHEMHAERYTVSEQAAETINSAQGRIFAVGTTSARTLESAAVGPRRIAAKEGETSLYVTPGYNFQVVDALVTNFHMPRSTLLLLVSALAGTEFIRRAYQTALDDDYRFLSFGDAMLIV